ncbi:MAG: hypothetical protein IH924_12065 [Proteobacteria bacterium]|nr:hypothetical protein [Pseudomonadota bacterium]
MSYASSPTLDQPAKAGAGPAAISTRKARRAEARNASERAFLDHYFQRLDPEVAASFTAEQRAAIATMFGARGVTRHAVEVRRSVPFPGGRRLYLVFLLGRERRTISRLYSQGMMSGSFNVAFYLGLGALFLLPVLILLTAGGQ